MPTPEYIPVKEALPLLTPYRIGRSTLYAKHFDSEEKRAALGVVMGPYGLLWERSRLNSFIRQIDRARRRPTGLAPGAPRLACNNLPDYRPCRTCNRRSNASRQCRWCGATGALYRDTR